MNINMQKIVNNITVTYPKCREGFEYLSVALDIFIVVTYHIHIELALNVVDYKCIKPVMVSF